MPALLNRVKEISNLVEKLSTPQQDALLKALRKQVLLDKAEQLNQSIMPNKVSMQQIIEEVRAVRKQDYAV